MVEQRDRDLLPIGETVALLRLTYPDVTHSSLRFLEAEGLITPSRTAGGHRLYSAAVRDRVALIKAWQERRLSLAEIKDRLRAQDELTPAAVLSERFLETALGDTVAASRLVLHAHEVGLPLPEVLQEVLRPAMVEIGDRWRAGRLRVGQEHEVTEAVRELVAELGLRHAGHQPAGPPILAACVAGERHDLGLRMLVALLRAAGRPVHFIGADVDVRFLLDEVRSRRPVAVLLSATTAERLPAIEATARALRADMAPGHLPIILGGQVVAGREAALRRLGLIPVGDHDLATALCSITAVLDEATAVVP